MMTDDTPPEWMDEAPMPDPEPAPKKARRKNLRVVDGSAQPEEWRTGLLVRLNRHGEPIPRACVANVMHVLEHHPAWVGVLAFDELREAPVVV